MEVVRVLNGVRGVNPNLFLVKMQENSLILFYLIVIHCSVNYQYTFVTQWLCSIDFLLLEKENAATLKYLSERCSLLLFWESFLDSSL